MNSFAAFFLCALVGSTVGYYVRESPYNIGPNDPFSTNQNYIQEPSQRLFWGNQGSNQVGGTGWWASLTNKFPFLGNMFGRLELPNQYGLPAEYQQQYFQTRPLGQFPQFFRGRDVGFTDDAVIVTPPHVPLGPQPAPEPAPGYQYNRPQYRLELPQK